MPSSSGTLYTDVRQKYRCSKQVDELLCVSSMKAEQFWRTLEEYSNFEEFQKSLSDEFPAVASERPAWLDRREFLSLVSASFAFAGLTSCALTVPEKIVPYVRQPQDVVPRTPSL